MTRIEPYFGEPHVGRLIAALRGEKTDRVPHFEILIEDQHVEKLLGRKGGNTLGVGGDPAKGAAAAEGARPMYPKDYVELCQLIGQDVIALEAIWTPLKHVRTDGRIAPITDRSVKTRADFEKIIWPGDNELEERLQYIREYVEAARGTHLGVVLLCGSIFQTIYEFVVGFVDCMVMVMEDPDLVEEMIRRSADYFAKLSRGAIQEGIDILFAADDFALKSGLFVRPPLFQKIWRPHYDRILAPAREAKIPIMFHSDGKIDDGIEMLLEMGVDGITPMDPSGVDYKDYKKRYGSRLTLFGNIDITWPLVQGNPTDVERDVRDHMEVLKPNGRWVAGSSHSIINYIPHENFISMINAFHKYGRYGN
ncbi:MAG: uroporphyrinogen decarboxylase family protein [Terriglobia bacterium]